MSKSLREANTKPVLIHMAAVVGVTIRSFGTARVQAVIAAKGGSSNYLMFINFYNENKRKSYPDVEGIWIHNKNSHLHITEKNIFIVKN